MQRMKEFREVRHVADLSYAEFPGEAPLEDGVLYVVDNSPYVEYNCPCGCGRVVTLPTKKHQCGYDGWGFKEEKGKVTLSPSVLSSGFPCRSHYFIRENRIDWC